MPLGTHHYNSPKLVASSYGQGLKVYDQAVFSQLIKGLTYDKENYQKDGHQEADKTEQKGCGKKVKEAA